MTTRHPVAFLPVALLLLLAAVPAAAEDQKTPPPPHRVDDVAQNPGDYLGKEIEVFGTVGQVFQDQRGLLLIDDEEFAACRTNVSCAVGRLIGVVLDSGTLPDVKKPIVVKGTLEKNPQGRFLLKATSYRERTP